MKKTIAISSGKGGTGKTSVSVNLFNLLNKKYNKKTLLVDCDVEEPNDILFFDSLEKLSTDVKNQIIPKIDINKCVFCKKCSEYCEFNAINVLPIMKYISIGSNLCHSCGACFYACDYNAIQEKLKSIGEVNYYKSKDGLDIVEGRLTIGSTMQTMMIKELKKSLKSYYDIYLLDSPPGTSCPVVETVSDADFIILVSEPTPFGLNDLKLTVDLLNEINKPFGVVVNKAKLGDQEIYDYLKANNIKLLGEIPFSKEYASNYSSGRLFDNIPKEIKESYNKILDNLILESVI